MKSVRSWFFSISLPAKLFKKKKNKPYHVLLYYLNKLYVTRKDTDDMDFLRWATNHDIFDYNIFSYLPSYQWVSDESD